MKMFLTLYLVAVFTMGEIPVPDKRQPTTIYPELAAFFQSFDNASFNREHITTLDYVKSSVLTSHLSADNWNIIFYCTDNGFRSQVAQVFTQTLCYLNRHRKIRVFSAGTSAGIVDQKLIDYFQKIGYKVSTVVNNGDKKIYEVRFSDSADPVVLFSKTTNDPSLPTQNLIPVIVCDLANERECTPLQAKSKYGALAFQTADRVSSGNQKEDIIKEIIAELKYVTKK